MVAKKMVLKFLTVSLSFLVLKTEAQNSSLQVDLTGLRSDKGHVLISLFKNDAGFPGDPSKAVQKLRVSVKDEKAIAKFNSVPKGVYAIAVLHDENDDMKMEKNFIGIPKEGFGFSNNAIRMTGPPSFKEASFEHDGNQVVEIKVKY